MERKILIYFFFRYLTDVDTNNVISRFMDEIIYTDILNEAFHFYEREVQKNMKVFIMNNYLPNQVGICQFAYHLAKMLFS